MRTKYTIFNTKKKITLNYSKSTDILFFQGTQERVRNSCGKRAISIRAIEVLYMLLISVVTIAAVDMTTPMLIHT